MSESSMSRSAFIAPLDVTKRAILVVLLIVTQHKFIQGIEETRMV